MTDAPAFEPYLGLWLYTLPGDEHHLYRVVPPRHEPTLDLTARVKGFQPFSRTPYRMALGPHPSCSVVRIPRIPFQVRIQELTRARAMEVIRFLVRLSIECHAHGYTPWDIHEGNVLWWDGPRFVDLDAPRPLTHQSAAMSFVRIGYLMYRYVFGRQLMDHTKFDFAALRKQGGWMAEQVGRSDFTAPDLWTGLRSVLDAAHAPSPPVTHWSQEYATGDLDTLAANPKISSVLDLVRPGDTLLDVGCNKGYVCRLLANRFDAVLGFDIDEASVDAATKDAAPGVNFAHFGIDHLRLVEPLPIHKRFEADVVLALALTHHLQNAGVPTATTAATLARLCRRELLIEDIADVGGYRQALTSHGLRVAQCVPSHPPSRTLTLWTR